MYKRVFAWYNILVARKSTSSNREDAVGESSKKYMRYKKLNERLAPEDRARLENAYQPCSVCGEEKRLIEFYPVSEKDRAGERSGECIVCRDVRNQEEGARRLAFRAKYGDMPACQAKRHELYAGLLARADAQDIFRLNTFWEVCVDCHVRKLWIEFYPKDWGFVSQGRVERCIACSDIRVPKKKETVQTPKSTL